MSDDTEDLTPEEWALIKGDAAPAPSPPAPDKEEIPEPDADGAQDEQPPEIEEPDDEDEPDERGKVPHAALHKTRLRLKDERQKREDAERLARELEAKHRETEAWRANAETRLQQLMAVVQQQQQPQQEPEPPPSLADDPMAYVENLAERQARLEAAERQRQEVAMRTRMATDLENHYLAEKEAFKQRHAPDFDDAVTYLANSRHAELAAQGLDEQQRNQVVQTEYLQALYTARQRGISPAAMFYQAAGARGYQRRAPQQQQLAATNGNGQARQPSVSLSGVGGSAGRVGKISLEDLANMPQDQFEKFIERSPKEFERLMGKRQTA